jgi:hypothetical protein
MEAEYYALKVLCFDVFLVLVPFLVGVLLGLLHEFSLVFGASSLVLGFSLARVDMKIFIGIG